MAVPPPDSAADKLLADAPLLLLFDFGADMLCANLTPLLSLFPRSSAPLLQILQRVFLVTKSKKVFAFVELGNFYLKEDEICLISKSNRCKIDKTKASQEAPVCWAEDKLQETRQWQACLGNDISVAHDHVIVSRAVRRGSQLLRFLVVCHLRLLVV